MQSAVRDISSRWDIRRCAETALLALLLFAAVPLSREAGPHAAEIATSVEIPGGQFRRLRMPNLPKDVVMEVMVQATGQLVVSLLNEQDARHFPRAVEPVFVGSVDRRFSFSVTIPAPGTYFLVLDNREGTEPRKVKLAIRAERGTSAPGARPPAPSLGPPSAGTRPDKL